MNQLREIQKWILILVVMTLMNKIIVQMMTLGTILMEVMMVQVMKIPMMEQVNLCLQLIQKLHIRRRQFGNKNFFALSGPHHLTASH